MGSKNIWFSRSIDQFETIENLAKNPISMLHALQEGLKSINLIPTYAHYRQWLDLVEQHIGKSENPYAEGSYIANCLWSISNGPKNAKQVFQSILKVALSGKRFDDSLLFLEACLSNS